MNLIGIALKASVVQREVNKKGYLLSVNINQTIYGMSACFYLREPKKEGIQALKMFDTNFRSNLDETLKEILDYVNEQTK